MSATVGSSHHVFDIIFMETNNFALVLDHWCLIILLLCCIQVETFQFMTAVNSILMFSSIVFLKLAIAREILVPVQCYLFMQLIYSSGKKRFFLSVVPVYTFWGVLLLYVSAQRANVFNSVSLSTTFRRAELSHFPSVYILYSATFGWCIIRSVYLISKIAYWAFFEKRIFCNFSHIYRCFSKVFSRHFKKRFFFSLLKVYVRKPIFVALNKLQHVQRRYTMLS